MSTLYSGFFVFLLLIEENWEIIVDFVVFLTVLKFFPQIVCLCLFVCLFYVYIQGQRLALGIILCHSAIYFWHGFSPYMCTLLSVLVWLVRTCLSLYMSSAVADTCHCHHPSPRWVLGFWTWVSNLSNCQIHLLTVAQDVDNRDS